MRYKTPGKCPACGEEMYVSELKCDNCKTVVSGSFEGCAFCKLDNKKMEFLLIYLKNRGNIKDIEQEMGISYPTVRNLLDNLLSELNLIPSQTKETGYVGKQKDIISKLSKGEITPQQAQELLRQIK